MMKESVTIESLNLDKPVYQITLRPTYVLIFTALFGVLFIVGGSWGFGFNWSLVLFGIIIVALVIFAFLKVKNRIIADLYKDQLVIYDEEDQTKGFQLFFSDIQTWEFKSDSRVGNQIIFLTQDGAPIVLQTSKTRETLTVLRKKIPAKEVRNNVIKFFNKKR